MTTRARPEVTPRRIAPRRIAPVPVQIAEPVTVERGDKVILLRDRLATLEASVARLTVAVVGLAVVLAAEGFPQALAALKALGLL